MRRVRARHLAQLIYLPRTLLTIQNWPRFLLAYAGIRPEKLKQLQLRSGATLLLPGKGPEDAATVAVVFVKKDYGDPPSHATILDVGAHVGCYAVYAAGQATGNRVYAFEPSPKNFELLIANIARNRFEGQIFPIGAAVAGRAGALPLYVRGGFDDSLYRAHPDEAAVEVRSLTLAQAIKSNNLTSIDLLKLDVEGAEFEILYATSPNDLRRIRAIRMEYHNLDTRSRNLESLLRFLRRHAFTTIWRKELNAVSGLVWLEQMEPP